MRHVRLIEYQTSDLVALSVEERDRLREVLPDLVVEPSRGQNGTYRLTPKSTIGVIGVGTLQVEVHPKIGVAPLLHLLSRLSSQPAWRVEPAFLRETNLIDGLTDIFVRLVDDAVRPGMLHGYRMHQETLVAVRGRIRLADQMRARTGLPLPIEVEFDEFTSDILENQLLSTAIDLLSRAASQNSMTRRALTRTRRHLHGTTLLHPRIDDVPEPVWTRLNQRYRPAVSLARLIIAARGIDAYSGNASGYSLLFDMNSVFENFIRTALREQLGLSSAAFPDRPRGIHYLDTQKNVRLVPDLSWWDGRRCLFIGDCKYKRPLASVPNADVYQTLAYLLAFGVDVGVIIYAADGFTPRTLTVPTGGKMIHLLTVDLATTPAHVYAQMTALARTVRSIRA